MIGIGWTEMLVIGVVALIFIGPKELPALMQRLGKAVASIRRMGSEFQREINRSAGLDQVTDLRRSITEPLKKTTAEIRREFNSMTATGVKPSGVLKPADPKAESVVTEIRAAAGLEAPAAPIKSGPVMTGPSPSAAKSARVKAPPRVRAAPTTPVVTADLPPVAPAAARKTPRKIAAKAVESPAPIEALAPVKEPAKPKPPAPKPPVKAKHAAKAKAKARPRPAKS
jgi:sec-independent protein translocase protein TatB